MLCTQHEFRAMAVSKWKTKYFSIAKAMIRLAVRVIVVQNWRIIRDICTEVGTANYATESEASPLQTFPFPPSIRCSLLTIIKL
jgi:hypothetical protein